MANTATIAWMRKDPPTVTPFLPVQTSTQTSGSGTSAAITMSATVINNLVVVHINLNQQSNTCSSVTDDVGNTYVLSPKLEGVNFCIYQAYGVQVIGGATVITVNFGSDNYRCGADEYSGGAITNAEVFDVSTTGTGTGTDVSVSTLTPAATGELIVATGGIKRISNTTWTAGANYTNYNGAALIHLKSEYRLSCAASETAPWTIAGSLDWAEIASAFKNLIIP